MRSHLARPSGRTGGHGPDPVIQEPTDVIIEITSSGICGSDLHLIEVMAPFMTVGDVMGHEPMGIVQRSARRHRGEGRRPRRRPVQHLVQHLLDVLAGAAVPVRDDAEPRTRATAPRCSATRSCTARCRAGRPSTCACRSATRCRSRCPTPRDDRFVYLSDVLPTAWQAVQYAGIPPGGSAPCSGSARSVTWRLHRTPPRRGTGRRSDVVRSASRARAWSHGDRLDRAGGRRLGRSGPHRRARSGRRHRRRRHGGARPARSLAQKATAVAGRGHGEGHAVVGVDRLAALNTAIEAVRRGGTISLSGVYGGATDPMPLMRMFDKQIQRAWGRPTSGAGCPTSCRC